VEKEKPPSRRAARFLGSEPKVMGCYHADDAGQSMAVECYMSCYSLLIWSEIEYPLVWQLEAHLVAGP
jgi:hypothetical protein